MNYVKSKDELKFSKEKKIQIISVAKQKKANIKLAIIEKEGISENEARQIAKKLGWELSKIKRQNVDKIKN